MTPDPMPNPTRRTRRDATRDTSRAQTLARSATRRRQVPEDAACVLCGERDPLVLTPETSPTTAAAARRLLEAHHVAGRAHEPDMTVWLCRNDHAKLTEVMRAGGVSMQPQANILERLIAVLTGVGRFLVALGETCLRWAAALARLLMGLDAAHPGWRAMPEAG